MSRDKLYFYLSGRRKSGKNDITTTGLAMLRRDGFASMKTESEGSLTIQKVKFNGEYFFVNAKVNGSLRVELINPVDNSPIEGFTKDDCITYKGDGTKEIIRWKDKDSLKELKGKKIKIRFYVEKGELFSFWISPWDTGESNGYTAGGGPGFHPAGIDRK